MLRVMAIQNQIMFRDPAPNHRLLIRNRIVLKDRTVTKLLVANRELIKKSVIKNR